LSVGNPYFLWAHGGEDHGGDSFESAGEGHALGQPIHLNKESQFLLGVRTTVAKKETLRKQLGTLGRIIPRVGSKARVYSPQAGRALLSPGGGLLLPGAQVKKGQILAMVEAVSRFPVRAPIAGVITEVGFSPGEQIESKQVLYTIIDPTHLWVAAEVYEVDLKWIEGAKAAFIIPEGYPDKHYQGKVISIGQVVDEKKRTIHVIIEILKPDSVLKVGQLAEIQLETLESTEAITVPASSVLEQNGRSIVFVHTDPEMFVGRIVTVGGVYGDRIAILDGLSLGDRVVTKGNYQLLFSKGK